MDFHLTTVGGYTSLLFLLPLLLTCTFLFNHYTRQRPAASQAPLPPGPTPWPVVGNLFSMGAKPHKSLAKIAATHGPLFRLQLGRRTTIVISSPAVAREVMLHHDAAFAGRSVQDAATVLGHYEASVVFMSPCPRWRFLRRICATYVFANSKLDAQRDMRREKVGQLVSHIESCSKVGQAVNISEVAFTTMLNILSNTIFSMDVAHLSSDYGREFKELVWSLMVVAGAPNIVDFFPILKVVDPQGARRCSTALVRRVFRIFDDIIDSRLKERKEGRRVEDKDVLDSLLTICQKEDNYFGRLDILHFLLDLFSAGIDTTSSTIEWAMTELLRHPQKLKKSQAELDAATIDKGNPLQESQLAQLPYLQAVIKETLRLHPPVPFLVPRNVEADAVELRGYSIPKDSQVLVNVWAMGRDAEAWERPDLFRPERFLGSELGYKGHEPELIPFGFGRRICPGLPLASRALVSVLAALIRSFEWEVPQGVGASEVDTEVGVDIGPEPDRTGPNRKPNLGFRRTEDRTEILGSVRFGFGPNSVRSGPGPNWTEFFKKMSLFINRSGSVQIRSDSVRFGPIRSKFGPNSVRFGPIRSDSVRFGPIRSDSVQIRSDLVRTEFGPTFFRSDRSGPKKSRFWTEPDRNQNGPFYGPWTGPTCARSSSVRSGSVRFGPKSRSGPNFVQPYTEDKFGFTLQKAQPLCIVPVIRK